MKAKVERNPPIAFKKCNVAFFPDLFFREEKICIEIDGGYHKKRIYQDTYRDDMFAMYDFTTIRVQNLDIRVEVSFWQRLVEGMEKMNRRTPSVDVFIDELQQMIDREIRSWTQF
jgi:very-short-patch-repair endonuclease